MKKVDRKTYFDFSDGRGGLPIKLRLVKAGLNEKTGDLVKLPENWD
jgi:hypothetical protein